MKKFVTVSLKKKAFIGITATLIPIVIMFFLSYNKNKAFLKQRILDTLTIIADSYEGQVYLFMEKTKQHTKDFASDGFVRTRLQKIIHGRKFADNVLNKHLIKNKLAINESINTIHVLSLEGRVVASTNNTDIGRDFSHETIFVKGRDSVTVEERYAGNGKLPNLAISAPILTKDTGKPIGVMVNLIQLTEINQLLSGEYIKEPGAISRGKDKGSWKTLDIYLVNREKRMITASRFNENVILRQVVDTLPVNVCLESNKEMAGFYKNYRGIEVLGASMYIPSMKWVLLAEISKDEVLAPIKYMLKYLLITAGVVIGLIVLLFITFFKNVLKPLCQLSNSIKGISCGNSDIPIPVLTHDEIGTLCESFNNMVRDIKASTSSLRKSEYRLAEAQRVAHIGNWEWDVIENEIYWSDEMYSIFGLSLQESHLTYEVFLQRVHPDDREFVKKSIDDALREKKHYDINYRILYKDATVRIVHAIGQVVFDETGMAIQMIGTVQDITNHKKMEDAIGLLHSMVMKDSVVDNLRDSLVFAMQRICSTTGWTCGETLMPNTSGTLLERFDAFYSSVDGLEKFDILSKRITFPIGIGFPGLALATKQPIWLRDVTQDPNYLRATIANELGLKTGIAFPIIADDEVVAVMVFYKHEELEKDEHLVKVVSSLLAQLGSFIKRKQIEENLLTLKNRLDFLLKVSPVMIYSAKYGDYRTTFISENVSLRLGYEPQQFIQNQAFWLDRVHPEDLPRIMDESLLLSKTDHMTMEYRFLHKNGTYRVMYDELNVVRDKEGNPLELIGCWVDITERRVMEEEQEKLREQLYHVQKLESIGTLAGGVAHDFNNILAIIVGYGNLLEKNIGKDNPSRFYVQKILKSSEKATSLVQGLLAFSRKQGSCQKSVVINKILIQVKNLLPRLIGEDIVLDIMLTDKECVVMADIGQIEQVLMNLATNARDAMPNGGKLTIRVDIVELSSEFIRTHGYGEIGTYALMSVSDTGIGMDNETQKRIFEPFFTTKEVGKGTGLGLSIVYGIIKQHGGYITVESEPGNGATFRIYLPVIKSIDEERKPTSLPVCLNGTETILIAEDEVEVRNLTKLLLEEAGYKVVEAVDGGNAIHKFMENKDDVSLLLLDVVLPSKSGREVYNEIRKIRPGIKALFMSGYSEGVINKRIILQEGLNFISKPFSQTMLLKKVREILDNSNLIATGAL